MKTPRVAAILKQPQAPRSSASDQPGPISHTKGMHIVEVSSDSDDDGHDIQPPSPLKKLASNPDRHGIYSLCDDL